MGESLSWKSHMMPLALRETRNSGSRYIGACCSPALLKAQPTLGATACCLLAVKSSRGRQVGVIAGVAADGHCSALSPGIAAVGTVDPVPNHFPSPPGSVSATLMSHLFITLLDRAR